MIRRFGVAIARVCILIVVLQWLAVKAVLDLRCHRPGYALVQMFIPNFHRKCNIGRIMVLESEYGHDESEAL